MVHPSFQPLRTSEPEEDDDDDCEPGEWAGAEDDVLMERPSVASGSSRQVRPTFSLGRLSLGILRNGKVAGALTLAVAGALALSLLAERRARAASAEGLRAAWARTRDSVEEDGVMQTGQTKAVVSVQQTQGGVYHGGCHCCCHNCCSHVAYCSSMACPAGYLQREGAEHIPCRSPGGTCTPQLDLGVCCIMRPTCEHYACQPGYSLMAGAGNIFCSGGYCGPEDNSICCALRATCDDYECPSGMALRAMAHNIMCAGGRCAQSDCCEGMPTPSPTLPTAPPPPDIVIVETPAPTPTPSPPAEVPPPPDIMLCDLWCFHEGVDSVSVELPEDEVKSLDRCRAACTDNEDCSAIVYRKEFQTTGESTCEGKKDIHIALCQPGEEYYTEILKHRPFGKCALLGDPHIVQWDRPPQLGKPTFDDYDAGDYVLMVSKDLTIHARFGFTERFPTATSTKGIAVHGAKIGNKALVAAYSEEQKRFIAWYDGKEIIPNKGDTFDDGLLVAKYADMDPTEFHTDARHTIGEDAEIHPSYTFEWKDVPLKIYMLLGPDNANVVLEMQKLVYAMDGLCGNFNCDPDDEDKAALTARGQAKVLGWQESNFQLAAATFHKKDFVKGTASTEAVLAGCDEELLAKGREACGGADNRVDDAQAQACLVDVCQAKSVDVAAMDVETVSIEKEAEVEINQ